MTLAESLKTHNPDALLHILVVDSDHFPNPPAPAGIDWVDFESLSESGNPLMRFYFDAFELCNALKPYLITHLFIQGFDHVIYLDCDIMVTGSFSKIWNELGEKSLLLTPHVLAPPTLTANDSAELGFADFGIYNGGFSAWRDTPASRAILSWMRDRFPRLGFCDPESRMFVDQKLLPLVHMYFPEEVAISKNPRLNIAYWNCHEREVNKRDSSWNINGKAVIFFHLSGFRIEQPTLPCAYQTTSVNQMHLKAAPWLSEVLSSYDRLLRSQMELDPIDGYGYSTYQNTRLTPSLRRLLYRDGKLSRSSFVFWRKFIPDRLREIKRAIIGKL